MTALEFLEKYISLLPVETHADFKDDFFNMTKERCRLFYDKGFEQGVMSEKQRKDHE